MSGVMVGTINLIYYAPGKVTYHMACRYPRKYQEFVICVYVHNTSHAVNVICPAPESLHAR